MNTFYPLKPKVKICDDFFVADTETGQQKGRYIHWQLNARPEKFIFGAVYGRNYQKVFHSLKEMLHDFATDPRYKGKTIFFHNFGKYDGSVLFDCIFDHDPEAILIGSRFISMQWKNKITFADSLNIYKASVKEIGKLLGIKKTMGGKKNAYKKSLWPRDKKRDEEGCLTDCRIVYDALFEIFEEAGDIKLTIGSLAMAYYRRFHMPFYIEYEPKLQKMFWDSYYGGRTEVIKKGKTHSSVIDVNSMYPRKMKDDFPNPKFLKYEEQIDVKDFLKNYLHQYEGAARVKVEHPQIWLGLLPFRDKDSKKLLFPVSKTKNSKFQGTWNFNELRFAVKHGVKITKVFAATYSEPMESIFKTFVDTLALGKFTAKMEGRALAEWKYKYLMNNLYGKFGQRIRTKTIYIKDINKQYHVIRRYQKEKKLVDYIPFNKDRDDCFIVVSTEEKMPKYSIPCFASYTTSGGRICLAEKALSMKKNRPVYFDTDSIFFEINTGIISSNVLGEWKLEDKIVTKVNALKNYTYISKGKKYDRIKGIPGRAKKIGKNRYQYSKLVGVKEGLKRSLKIGSPLEVIKEVKNTYDKRIVFSNGETKPILI